MEKKIVILICFQLLASTIQFAQVDCSKIEIKVFQKTSEKKSTRPEVTVKVDEGYKILGGGAALNYDPVPGHPGTLLTESYPLSDYEWKARGKDHMVPYASTITAYAIAIHDPNGCWDVIRSERIGLLSISQLTIENNGINIMDMGHPNPISLMEDMSEKEYTENYGSPNPEAIAVLPEGYILTGGGARIVFNGPGNLLYSSAPYGDNGWIVKAKQHVVISPQAHARAYAIGIKPSAKNNNKIMNRIVSLESDYALSPQQNVVLQGGFQLTGGGCKTYWPSIGSLIYKSYPDIDKNQWVGKAKAHYDPVLSTITTYAIGVKMNN